VQGHKTEEHQDTPTSTIDRDNKWTWIQFLQQLRQS